MLTYDEFLGVMRVTEGMLQHGGTPAEYFIELASTMKPEVEHFPEYLRKRWDPIINARVPTDDEQNSIFQHTANYLTDIQRGDDPDGYGIAGGGFDELSFKKCRGGFHLYAGKVKLTLTPIKFDMDKLLGDEVVHGGELTKADVNSYMQYVKNDHGYSGPQWGTVRTYTRMFLNKLSEAQREAARDEVDWLEECILNAKGPTTLAEYKPFNTHISRMLTRLGI